MIEEGLPPRLIAVAQDLERIAEAHHKCLACHCYREVAAEAVSSLELIQGHAELVDGGVSGTVPGGIRRLRALLDSSEGSHG